jgi:hypothetical protein
MIPRLDIAVERGAFGARFDGPPWWATLEQVTERLRGTIPDTYGAAELRAQGETLQRQAPRQHRYGRLGAHQLQWGVRLAVRTAQREGSALRNLRSAFLECGLKYVLEQISR